MNSQVEKIKTEIVELIKHDELIADGDSKMNELVNRELETLYHLSKFIDSLQEEPVSEDLEYASEKYACRFSSSKYGHDKVKDAFIAGAQRQKERMLNNAIEREVKVDAGGYPYIDVTELYDYDKDRPLAKEGDKVKLIIIMEE